MIVLLARSSLSTVVSGRVVLVKLSLVMGCRYR
jgi:hypothetical protein